MTPVLRKVAALALLGLLLAGPATAFYVYAYQPSVELRAGVVDRRAAVARIEHKVNRLNRRLAALDGLEPGVSGLWEGEANRIGLAVQTKVQALGKETGFAIRAVQPMAGRRFADAEAVVLMAQARSGYGALVKFIHAIEASEPVLLIDKMTVRVIRQGQADGELPIVDARLELLAPTGGTEKDR